MADISNNEINILYINAGIDIWNQELWNIYDISDDEKQNEINMQVLIEFFLKTYETYGLVKNNYFDNYNKIFLNGTSNTYALYYDEFNKNNIQQILDKNYATYDRQSNLLFNILNYVLNLNKKNTPVVGLKNKNIDNKPNYKSTPKDKLNVYTCNYLNKIFQEYQKININKILDYYITNSNTHLVVFGELCANSINNNLDINKYLNLDKTLIQMYPMTKGFDNIDKLNITETNENYKKTFATGLIVHKSHSISMLHDCNIKNLVCTNNKVNILSKDTTNTSIILLPEILYNSQITISQINTDIFIIINVHNRISNFIGQTNFYIQLLKIIKFSTDNQINCLILGDFNLNLDMNNQMFNAFCDNFNNIQSSQIHNIGILLYSHLNKYTYTTTEKHAIVSSAHPFVNIKLVVKNNLNQNIELSTVKSNFISVESDLFRNVYSENNININNSNISLFKNKLQENTNKKYLLTEKIETNKWRRNSDINTRSIVSNKNDTNIWRNNTQAPILNPMPYIKSRAKSEASTSNNWRKDK